MSPVSGQFHPYSTKSTPKRLTGGDPVALVQRRGNVEEQAHPAAAMIDDDNRIVTPERA
jgi:hypothetical protein